mgnify:CR=1 FL=1
MFSLFSSKLHHQRQQRINAIKEELAGRWDLSRTFSLVGEGEGNVLIDAINRIFSRLHLFVIELTKGNVATATVAPLTQAIAGQVRASSESLAGEVEQIETTCRTLAEGIGASVDSAGQALEQSAAIVDAIDQTSQVTDQALQRMQSMEQEVARLTVSIGELDQRSRSIGTIIESISEIADHTGLLSLNAFIEAARAGEHGAGFGVIAQEVRQLSQETAKSAAARRGSRAERLGHSLQIFLVVEMHDHRARSVASDADLDLGAQGPLHQVLEDRHVRVLPLLRLGRTGTPAARAAGLSAECFRFAHGELLRHDAPGNGRLGVAVGQGEQRPAVAFGQPSLGDRALQGLRQLQQPQRVGHSGPRLAQALGQLLLGEAELLQAAAVGDGRLNGVDVLAL